MLRLFPNGLKAQEYRAALVLLLPATLGLLVFAFVPIAQAFHISFFDAPLIAPQRTFIGLENYTSALNDTVFRRALLNTVVYAASIVVLQVVVALGLALLIRKAIPGVGFFRSSYFLPVMTSLVVVSTVWKIMYHADNGLINSVLRTLSLTPQPWLTSPDHALLSLVIIGVWKEVGFSMLVLLGGLQSIPKDMYEAASIDGSSAWNSFWRITLPLLRRPLLFVVVLSTITAFKLFTPVYVITDGGPADSTQTLVFYIYQTAFRYFKMGYAAAQSFLLLALVLLLTFVQFRMLRSDVEY